MIFKLMRMHCVYFVQNYRYQASPTDDGVANGKSGKGKKSKKADLENLKREVEMVKTFRLYIVRLT
jgi:hypothetical protein